MSKRSDLMTAFLNVHTHSVLNDNWISKKISFKNYSRVRESHLLFSHLPSDNFNLNYVTSVSECWEKPKKLLLLNLIYDSSQVDLCTRRAHINFPWKS